MHVVPAEEEQRIAATGRAHLLDDPRRPTGEPLAEGPADASFGVHVAQMAGVPDAVTARAREVLGKLERDATVDVSTAGGPVQAVFDLAQAAAAEQKADPLRDEIRKLDLMNMTPLQALEKLHDLQQELL